MTRSTVWPPAAAFLTSETERARPVVRLLRILKRVKPAPMSMPPMAMGRTMNFHTAADRANQSSMVAPSGIE